MSPLILHAPAKINLSLKILRKREDGFHELETLIAPVKNLYDTLTFTEAGQFEFSCDDASVPTDASNLVVRAVRGFEERAGLQVSEVLHLEKRIPHGAGLGGGSSDAASTLLGLNTLYHELLTFLELHEIAAEIGSDVPFFLYQSPCLCRGRGELIEPVPVVSAFPVLLLKPHFSVPTPDAFRRWQASREVASFCYASQSGPYGEMVNDLERPVYEKYLFLGELKGWLLQQPEVAVAQMSGSGSTMIVILHDLEQAGGLIHRVKEQWDPHLFTWHGLV